VSGSTESDSELFDRLAEEFLARCRRGEQPSPEEYARAHAALADRIRGLFPTLLALEGAAGPGPEAPPTRRGAEPAVLGEFRILREVGRGGMGVVYEAIQEPLGRRVALKVLPAEVSDRPNYRERFEREARAAAKLHHTNIVPVFASGECDGTLFFAMQFIEGTSLAGLIAGRRGGSQAQTPTAARTNWPGAANAESAARAQVPLSDSRPPGPDAHEVARCGLQAAGALAYAHAQGILHRDIKPGNLLVDAQGTLWVADFGLAKAEGTADLTESGELVGTLRYLAPERFGGTADARSDVYALGLTLYELLTLRPAFDAPDLLKLLEEIQSRQPPRPRALEPRIPRDLETVVLKAMSKAPVQRYATAAELAEDLRRFLADEPVRARPISWRGHVVRWCRRNPLPAILAAAVLLLLSAVAVVSSVASLRLTAKSTALATSLDESERLRREALAKLWDSSLQRARASRSSHRPGQRFDALRAIREALALPVPAGRSRDELRNEAVAALLLPDLETAWEWRGLASEDAVVAFDRDLGRFACSDPLGNVSVCRGDDRGELYRLTGPGAAVVPNGLRFSPDGHYLAVAHQAGNGHKHRLWKLGGPREELLVEAHWLAFDFSPDGREFAARYPDGSIRVAALSTRTERARLPCGLPREPGLLAWNPVLPQIAVTSQNTWQVLSLENGQKLLAGQLGRLDLRCVWHSDGRTLAVAGGLPHIALWDVTNRTALGGLSPASGVSIRSFAFDHSGGLGVSNDPAGSLRLWNLATRQEILQGSARGPLVQFSRDDKLLVASVEGTALRAWRCATGGELRAVSVLRPAASVVRHVIDHVSLNCRPDSDLVAVGVRPGCALIDLADARQVGFLPDVSVRPLRFELHGKALLTYGPLGIHRWPLMDEAPDVLRCGPPQQVLRYNFDTGRPAAMSCDGQVTAFGNGFATIVWDLRAGKVRVMGEQAGADHCAVSPDGQWVAAGCHRLLQGGGARIYETQSGKLAAELPVGNESFVTWSPDGRWLLTGGGREYRLWEAATWKGVARCGKAPPLGTAVFTPDARLLGVADNQGTVRLLSVPAGEEIGRLATPELAPLHPLFFTPDGARLAACDHGRGVLFVFDLRLIRAGLAELGLDWDDSVWPRFPPPRQGRRITNVDFDPGDLLPPKPAQPRK
jgi:serine/threonine protein kinase/WD40 repeat protein